MTAGQFQFVPGTGQTTFTFQAQDTGGTANGGVDLDPTARTITFNVTGIANTLPAGTNKTVNALEDVGLSLPAQRLPDHQRCRGQ